MSDRPRDDAPTIIPPEALAAPMPGWPADASAHAAALVASLRSASWFPGWRITKRERLNLTILGALNTPDGPVDVVLKQIALRRSPIGRAQELLRRTRAQRQCAGARLIADLGVPVSEPLALLRANFEGARFDWLLLRALPGTDLIRCLADPRFSPHERSLAAAAAGRLIRRLADARLLNRDHKLSNQILLDTGEIGLIDTVGVRRAVGPSPASARAVRMLTSMMRESIGTRLFPARTIRWRCLRAASDDPFTLWHALEAAAADNGDTTPRIDPTR